MALNFPASPSNGDTYEGYVWNETVGAWQTITAGSSLNYLDDVEITSPSVGDGFVYDGTDWVNAPKSGNAIINGDFSVWQRGTSFSSLNIANYTADRWQVLFDGSGATRTVTREAFSPGEIELDGCGTPEYFFRYDHSVAGTGATFNILANPIEDVRTFSGQSVTMSFWAKSSTSSSITPGIKQTFGTGGSSQVFASSGAITLTSSWVRYNVSLSVPSVSGKTIGAGSSLSAEFSLPTNEVYEIDLWGVQLESGPVATAFCPAGGGSKAAELSLCHRYYFRVNPISGGVIATGYNTSSTAAVFNVYFPQEMRIAPAAIDQSFYGPNYAIQHGDFVKTNTSDYPAYVSGSKTNATLTAGVASGLTAGQGSMLIGNNPDGYLAWSAEL